MAETKIPKGYKGIYAKNSSGADTLIAVSREVGADPKKEQNMAEKKRNSGGSKPAAKNSNSFQPTFRKYTDMSSGEQEAFRQGAKTVENKIKENLGLKKPR